MLTNDEHDASYNEEKDKTKQYVIGAIDEVSKYLVTRVIPSKRTKDVVDYLLCDIIHEFGVPTILTSDNAQEFFSKVMNEIIAMFNIQCIHTSRFRPRANGVIEVRWRHLKNIIERNYALDDIQNLNRIVTAAIFALNQWVCSSTNCAPNAVMFNFMPSSPTMFPLYHQDITQKAMDQKLIDNERQRITLFKVIRTRILNKQIQRNNQANKHRAKMEPYKEKDHVLIKVHNPTTMKKITPKFTPDFNGDPFIVQKVKKGYLLLFDHSELSSFYEHCDNTRKCHMPKTSPNPLYHLEKGISIPENESEFRKQLFWNPNAEDDTPPPSNLDFTRKEIPKEFFPQRRTKVKKLPTNKRISKRKSKRF